MYWTEEKEKIIKTRARIIGMWIGSFLFQTPILFFIKW